MKDDFDIFIWQRGWKGGAERITLGMAKIFKEKFNITPTLGVFEKNPASEFPQIRVPRILPSRFVGYNQIWASYHLNRRGITDEFDIIFTHCAGLWKTANNFHAYYEPEDVENEFYTDSILKRWSYSYLRAMTKNTLRKSDFPICTDNSEGYFQRIGLNDYEKTTGFADLEKFQPAGSGAGRESGKAEVLFVGRRDPRKNFDALKKACLSLENKVELKVIGFSSEDVKNITYLGRVPEEELVQAYREADLFVLPSYYEGSGLSALEALFCGTPVIYSKTACPESLEDYLILCEPTAEDIERKITHFLENKDNINEELEKNLEEIRGRFSRENVLSGLAQNILEKAREILA